MRVPRDRARAMGWSGGAPEVSQVSTVLQGFHKIPKGSAMFHQGFQKCSARFRGLPWREAVCRAPVV